MDCPRPYSKKRGLSLGFKSKTDTIVVALRELVRRQRLDERKGMMGNVRLEIDVPASRRPPKRARS